MRKYDMITPDLVGHVYGEDYFDEDVSATITSDISDIISDLKENLNYYNLFSDCLREYTNFEIKQALMLIDEIRKNKSNMDFGNRHLAGENCGSWGKECSVKIKEFEKKEEKLNNLWNKVPQNLRQLVTYWDEKERYA